jgi:6-phosphogluconate dehydrogenase
MQNIAAGEEAQSMELAMVGLGKMGANMATRLLREGHRVIVYDINIEAVQTIVKMGGEAAQTYLEIAHLLTPPRTAWIMVPSGRITEETIFALADIFSPGDTLIDGGNSNYKDSQRRAGLLQSRGIHFIDVGTSGGIWGLSEGYSLMIGGEAENVKRHRAIFETLAPSPEKGWGHVGSHGAGHFVKMIHNGIEYGLMQAYAEGFEILHAKPDYDLDLHQIADIWRTGSVVRSWLLDLTARALADNPDLEGIKGWVADSGEGRWTVFESIDLDVPAPVISLALQMRFASRQDESFSAKLLAALRNQFGGHEVRKE